MNIKNKLSNPFALVAQGFGLGAILFFASVPLDSDSQTQAQQSRSASLAADREA